MSTLTNWNDRQNKIKIYLLKKSPKVFLVILVTVFVNTNMATFSTEQDKHLKKKKEWQAATGFFRIPSSGSFDSTGLVRQFWNKFLSNSTCSQFFQQMNLRPSSSGLRPETNLQKIMEKKVKQIELQHGRRCEVVGRDPAAISSTVCCGKLVERNSLVSRPQKLVAELVEANNFSLKAK